MNNDLNYGQNLPPQNGIGSVAASPLAMVSEPLAYDVNQAAAKLNVSTKTIRRLLARGKLTCCKVLRKILIPREQVENFMKRTCDKPNLE